MLPFRPVARCRKPPEGVARLLDKRGDPDHSYLSPARDSFGQLSVRGNEVTLAPRRIDDKVEAFDQDRTLDRVARVAPNDSGVTRAEKPVEQVNKGELDDLQLGETSLGLSLSKDAALDPDAPFGRGHASDLTSKALRDAPDSVR
jgi:hypothetical protein